MRTLFARFVNDESGDTAIESGLIAAGIAVAIIVSVNASVPICRPCSAASPAS